MIKIRERRGVEAVITKKVVMTVPFGTSDIETGNKWAPELGRPIMGSARQALRKALRVCGEGRQGGREACLSSAV